MNAFLAGDPDETLSSRAGKYKNDYWYWNWLATALDFFFPNHTDNSIEKDEGKHEVGR